VDIGLIIRTRKPTAKNIYAAYNCHSDITDSFSRLEYTSCTNDVTSSLKFVEVEKQTGHCRCSLYCVSLYSLRGQKLLGQPSYSVV